LQSLRPQVCRRRRYCATRTRSCSIEMRNRVQPEPTRFRRDRAHLTVGHGRSAASSLGTCLTDLSQDLLYRWPSTVHHGQFVRVGVPCPRPAEGCERLGASACRSQDRPDRGGWAWSA
jgi:hypothetical protein